MILGFQRGYLLLKLTDATIFQSRLFRPEDEVSTYFLF